MDVSYKKYSKSNYTKQDKQNSLLQLMLSYNQCMVHACDWPTLILVLDNHTNSVGLLLVHPKV